MTHPPIELSALRQIGWREWDPIGLCPPEGWRASSIADEYDTYLVHVAARLQNGDADADLADYLITIETERMGLGMTESTRPRAVATIAALRKYIEGVG